MKNNKYIKIITGIIIFVFLTSNVPQIFIKTIVLAAENPVANRANIEDNTAVINNEIKNINSDIDSKKNQIKRIQEKQSKYSEAIKQKQSERASLNNQLAILDNRLAKAELDIELVKTDIEKVVLEIQKTDNDIKTKNEEIEQEKIDIARALKLIHKQDNVSNLEIILVNNSLSDFLNQAKYLEDVTESLKESLDSLEKNKRQLTKEKEKLDKKNDELSGLRSSMEKKKKQLAAEKKNNMYIMEQINVSEAQYQRLLAQAKQEQQAAAADIASMEKLVRAKLAKLKGKKLAFNDNGLIWPVPKNVINAYFHDPDYPFRKIFEHPGVDIRAAQGTTLRAAASGYVARAKNGGKGYSYIMIIHGDGLSTVYGHVSKILVNEDEYVTQGQVIGATGGLPGTPGAGRLTTGPHLHFEVRLNGIPVDPLGYLP